MKPFKQATAKAAKILSDYFDVDFLDVFRKLPEAPGRARLYTNIPCHYQILRADNPDPMTIDIMPIVSTVQINMPFEVDVQSGDYLIVKRTDEFNEILAVYHGVCGQPNVNHLRKNILMSINTAAISEEFPNSEPEDHETVLVYEEEIIEGHFCLLANGAFICNDGTFTSGYHLLKKTPFKIANKYDQGQYDVVVSKDHITHPELGTLLFTAGKILKIFTTNEWIQISSGAVLQSNGVFLFKTMPYNPSPKEKAAAVTLWYD